MAGGLGTNRKTRVVDGRVRRMVDWARKAMHAFIQHVPFLAKNATHHEHSAVGLCGASVAIPTSTQVCMAEKGQDF